MSAVLSIARNLTTGSVRRVLQPALGMDDFDRGSIDRYTITDSFIGFNCRDLAGLVLFGCLDAATIRDVEMVLPTQSAPPAVPHPVYLDLRLVDSFNPELLESRARALHAHRELVVRCFTRVAIVHPPGIVGAVTIGLRSLAAPLPVPEKFFTDPAEALRWLGRESRLGLLDELEVVRGEALGLTPLIRKVRELLDREPRLSLGGVARALAMSRRSLQRSLSRAGTSYRAEVAFATVGVAKRQMRDTDATVSEVAYDVGCASPQHLNKLFRRVTGESPTAWRMRARAR